MSEVYLFKSFGQDKKKVADNKRLNKILWTIIIILIIVIIVEVVFQFLVAPNIRIENIFIESELNLSKDEVLDLAGLTKSEYYFALNAQEICDNLEKYPPVALARVEKHFPSTLKIKLWERKPLGCYLFKQDKRHIPLLFDEKGMVFKIAQGELSWDMPVISGLKTQEVRIGKYLPDNLVNLVADLQRLREANSPLFDVLSEVELIPVSQRDFELAVYLIPYRTRLRLGDRINSGDIKYALMMLDVLSQKGMDSPEHEIDFRTKEVVYRSKGGEGE
ncbi:MAG: FtsQ-type POTRA domain-containing protein [Spirochaetales bacterium]|nr:FtsQ-type POTRA domain-containing protein [Spirochaetales bacterium]